MAEGAPMQHDEHIWAWRQWRFYMTGFLIGMIEIDAAGDLQRRFIDPRDYFA